MAELPDFNQIARQLHHLIAPLPRAAGEQEIVEQLRQVWNARGAADLETVRRELLGTCPDQRHDDPDNSGLCIKCGAVLDYMEPGERAGQLADAFRNLDR